MPKSVSTGSIAQAPDVQATLMPTIASVHLSATRFILVDSEPVGRRSHLLSLSRAIGAVELIRHGNRKLGKRGVQSTWLECAGGTGEANDAGPPRLAKRARRSRPERAGAGLRPCAGSVTEAPGPPRQAITAIDTIRAPARIRNAPCTRTSGPCPRKCRCVHDRS